MAKPPTEPPPTEIDADFSEEEIKRRRDEVARRMLSTPYKPQKPKGDGAPKKKRKAPTKA